MDRLLGLIDKASEMLGKAAGWLLLPLSFFVTYEVVLRYVFDKPTIWVWDLGVQLQAAIVALGGAYALREHSHVSIDILVTRLSRKKRAILDSITYVFVFFGLSVLLWRLWVSTQFAVKISEKWTSYWAPPIYPLKILILVTVCVLLLQAMANWIRILRSLSSDYSDDGTRH